MSILGLHYRAKVLLSLCAWEYLPVIEASSLIQTFPNGRRTNWLPAAERGPGLVSDGTLQGVPTALFGSTREMESIRSMVLQIGTASCLWSDSSTDITNRLAEISRAPADEEDSAVPCITHSTLSLHNPSEYRASKKK
jgi:hypothetical protein